MILGYLGGHGRAKGVGGQEDWEGRRSGRAGGQDKYKLLEGPGLVLSVGIRS